MGVKLLPLRSGSLRRKVVLNFVICLHIRDEELIKSLVSYFKSLNIQVSANAYLQQASPLVQAKRESEDITIVQAWTEHEQKVVGFAEKSSNHIYKTGKTVTLYFRKFSDIVNIIIPFFEKYPVIGQKSLDFSDFKKVALRAPRSALRAPRSAEIVKTKRHLTPEGFNEVVNINLTMNQRRPWS